MEENATLQQKKNIFRLREDMKMRYFDAPDLKNVGKNAYRFINAVSDFATHAQPLRKTANYKEGANDEYIIYGFDSYDEMRKLFVGQ